MLPYMALTRMAIRRTFVYRTAVFAGLVTNTFFGFLRAAVMVALYGIHPVVAGYSLQDAITYTGLAQACIGFLTLFSWFEIVYSVNNGQVGADLLKPMSYFGFWMAQDFGRSAVNLLLRGVPIMVLYAVLYDITVPGSFSAWLAVGVSLLLAWLVSFTFRFLINLSAFWVPNAVGVCRLFFALSWFMSGFFMPLRFFPDWFVRLCYLTPFPQLINTPIEVYMGHLSSSELMAALVYQAVWGLGLALAGQLVLAAGVRRLVIQGG
jgi:ABC-2 type transport system permease protein